MTDTPGRPTREERLAKLAAARASTAARGTADVPSGPGADPSAAEPTRRPRRSRSASGARVVVGAMSVAGFTVMTHAMGPLVAPAEPASSDTEPVDTPTTQPSVVVRLVDENGDPISTDTPAAKGSGSDMGVLSTVDQAGLLETDPDAASTDAGAGPAGSAQTSTNPTGPTPVAPAPARTQPSPAPTAGPTPAPAPAPAPVPVQPTAPAPTTPPVTAAPPPPPPTTTPPPPRSSASG